MNRAHHLLQAARHLAQSLRHWIGHALARVNLSQVAKDAVLLLVVLQLAVIGMNSLNRNNPILGLRLEGQPVGQLGGGDSRKHAETIVNDRENKRLAVKVVDQTSAITLRQLGVNTDEKQLHKTLLEPGRSGNIVRRIIDQDLALLGLRNVSLGNPNFNAELATGYISTLNQKIALPPVNAHFIAKDQKAAIEPDVPGRAIDADAAMSALRRANPDNNTPVVLATKQVSATATTALLTPLLPQVQAIAQKPLIIVAGGVRVTLSPEQLIGLVVPKVVPDAKDPKKMTAQITFDEAKLNAAVDEAVRQAVVSPKPTIMSGGRVVQQGKSGLRTEDSHSLARVLAVIVQRQTGAGAPDEAHIPLVAVEPPVVQQRAASSVSSRTGTGLVRLTFDDGPGAYTEQVLDILSRYNVRATFYVIGRNVERYPGTMQRIRNEGHRLGNHSYSHSNLTRLSRGGVVQELASTQTAVQNTAGVTPTGFRPPYGAYNQTVREVAASMGMSLDMWSVDTNDWARPGSGVIKRRVLDNVTAGSVVLMHVLNQQTVDALPGIIEGIRAQGYTLE